MTVSPESIEVGKCYLVEGGQIRRVTMLYPGGEVRYVSREAVTIRKFGGVEAQDALDAFASEALREVPCDWTPETE